LILKMFPRARVTLLGDTNQAIISELNTTSKEDLAKIYNAKTLNLNKSYRSTKEINSYALELLPEEKRYEIFERSGKDVKELSGNIEEFKNAVTDMAKTSPSTCIITRNLKEAVEAYNELKTTISGLRICDNKSFELSHNPIVMPLALTKGLEFDNVIVYDKDSAFSGEENKKYLYMASTRALHRLTIFEVK
ncbi:MAG: ATP-binding domain-containing protein, partial [Clostridia bacterium]|nr:ATP-binding domain-containing protein [Clostridia bacterium]